MKEKLAITCYRDFGCIAGAGAVYQAELLGYLLAKFWGCTLLRFELNPSAETEARDEYRVDSEVKWKKIMDFLGPTHHPSEYDKVCAQYERVLNLDIWQINDYLEMLPDATWMILLNELRCRFRNTVSNSSTVSDRESPLKLALHLRNFDPCCPRSFDTLPYQMFSFDYGMEDQNPEFYADLYAGLIGKEFSFCKTMDIDIVSLGDEKDFQKIIENLRGLGFENVNLKLNRASHNDFLDLVGANYLVLAQSSFSYIAALLSPAPKFIRDSFRLRLPSDVFCFSDNVVLNFNFKRKLTYQLKRIRTARGLARQEIKALFRKKSKSFL